MKLLLLLLSFSVLVFQQVSSQELPVGRFVGLLRYGELDGELTGEPYPFEVVIESDGAITSELPSLECGSTEVSADSYEAGRIEYTYINAYGNCLSPVSNLLTRVSGIEWLLQWETQDQFGEGILYFQCSNDCDVGYTCNSELTNDAKPGECVPIGSHPVGKFVGAYKNGALGGPLTSDPLPIEITVRPDGYISVDLPAFGCGAVGLTPDVLEWAAVEFVKIEQYGPCMPRPQYTLSHLSGNQWSFRWEETEEYFQYGEGVLYFQCSNDCDVGYTCNSELMNEANLGECVPIGSHPVGKFVGAYKNGALGGPLTSDPLPIEITVRPDGYISVDLPAFGCGAAGLTPNVLEWAAVEFVKIEQYGPCMPRPQYTLSHLSGNQWSFRWEETEEYFQYGEGVLYFQCSNVCIEESSCNSEPDGVILGVCLPRGDWYPEGTFVGTSRSGAIGEPLSSDPYPVEFSVRSSGRITGGGTCRMTTPAPPNIFRNGTLSFLLQYDNSDSCAETYPEHSYVALTHVSGDEWELYWEYGDSYSEGTFRFDCSNSCGLRQVCQSTYSSNGELGWCKQITLDDQNLLANEAALCPLDTVASADPNDGRVTILNVYSDSFESASYGADYASHTDEDETPTISTLRGQEVTTSGLGGCSVALRVALRVAQRQGDSVCIGYEHEERGDTIAATCGNICIGVGSTRSFEYYKFDTFACFDWTGSCGGSTKTRDCRIFVEEEETTAPIVQETDPPVQTTATPTNAPVDEAMANAPGDVTITVAPSDTEAADATEVGQSPLENVLTNHLP